MPTTSKRISELNKDYRSIENQINPDDPFGKLIAGAADTVDFKCGLKVFRLNIPNAFVMNHSTLSILDDTDYPLNQGRPGKATFPLVFPIKFDQDTIKVFEKEC